MNFGQLSLKESNDALKCDIGDRMWVDELDLGDRINSIGIKPLYEGHSVIGVANSGQDRNLNRLIG
jgi:hypothetical protein